MSEFRAFVLVMLAPIWGPALMFYGVITTLSKLAVQWIHRKKK